MQFFCLNPRWENYQEISSNIKLKGITPNSEIWDLAVWNKYGKVWERKDEEKEERFEREFQNISQQLSNKPNLILLEKMWHIFFATGDLPVLQLISEVVENRKTLENLKEISLEMFQKIREEYSQKIKEYLRKSPNFFTQHEIKEKNEEPWALTNSRVFEKFDQMTQSSPKKEKKKKELKEALDLFDEISKNVITKCTFPGKSKKR